MGRAPEAETKMDDQRLVFRHPYPRGQSPPLRNWRTVTPDKAGLPQTGHDSALRDKDSLKNAQQKSGKKENN